MDVDRWRFSTLGEIVNLKRGYDLPKRLRVDGPFPIVSSSGVTGAHFEPRVEPPGVVTGRYGTLGTVHYIEQPYWPLNTTLYVQDFKGNHERFVAYLLESLNLSALVSSAAVPGINRNHLHPLQVQVPDRSLQASIAEALGVFDDLVENNRRRIEILEEMAWLLYREWFVHFRFPGHEDVGLVDSDLGPIPEGWEVRSFAELADFVNGFAFKPEHWHDEGLPIVKIKELKNGVTNDTPRYHGVDVSEKYFVADGSVLFSWSADLKAYVWASGPGLLNQHLFDVRPYEVSHLFIFLSLNERMDEFRARAQGTTMKHIKRSALGEVKMALPKKKLRDEFESVARPMLDLQLNLSKQNRALREARDLLLPRLVSGELDVSELDLGLEAVEA